MVEYMTQQKMDTSLLFALASVAGSRITKDLESLCGFSIFLVQLALQFSGCLFFTISLNLQLVVIHEFSGRKFEKFYITGSAAIAIILTVPPYATGKFGWDPLEGCCWYSLKSSKEDKLIWEITTQMIWTALTAIGEFVNSAYVIIWMWKYNQCVRYITQPSSKNSSEDDQSNQTPFHFIDYKKIFIRISLYPLVSCFINLLSTFASVFSTINNGYHNQTDYHILLLSDCLYGGRPLVYAILAASDPAFIRGSKSLLNHLLSRHRSGQSPKPVLCASETKLSPPELSPSPMANDPPISSDNVSDTMIRIEVSTITHHNRSLSASESKIEHVFNDPSEFDMGMEFGVVKSNTTTTTQGRGSACLFRGSDQEKQEEDAFLEAGVITIYQVLRKYEQHITFCPGKGG
ncbi:hypothetical protein K435DRAFT_794311 [Dendrothele bispora CBS 962.96]|uniref:Glucose receptor Git3 N-terminal domain-containing protein n=1 Tax=Dendrothele bispora (strain CBS 962.96) TaxID=1314807 RepID=A0A4S8MDT1_DENBC|nr:hypothetical protein K435DRAFT_794311 [Dendrothele bispora CBS 962.96]